MEGDLLELQPLRVADGRTSTCCDGPTWRPPAACLLSGRQRANHRPGLRGAPRGAALRAADRRCGAILAPAGLLGQRGRHPVRRMAELFKISRTEAMPTEGLAGQTAAGRRAWPCCNCWRADTDLDAKSPLACASAVDRSPAGVQDALRRQRNFLTTVVWAGLSVPGWREPAPAG